MVCYSLLRNSAQRWWNWPTSITTRVISSCQYKNQSLFWRSTRLKFIVALKTAEVIMTPEKQSRTLLLLILRSNLPLPRCPNESNNHSNYQPETESSDTDSTESGSSNTNSTASYSVSSMGKHHKKVPGARAFPTLITQIMLDYNTRFLSQNSCQQYPMF